MVLLQVDARGSIFPYPPHEAALSVFNFIFYQLKNFEKALTNEKELPSMPNQTLSKTIYLEKNRSVVQ